MAKEVRESKIVAANKEYAKSIRDGINNSADLNLCIKDLKNLIGIETELLEDSTFSCCGTSPQPPSLQILERMGALEKSLVALGEGNIAEAKDMLEKYETLS